MRKVSWTHKILLQLPLIFKILFIVLSRKCTLVLFLRNGDEHFSIPTCIYQLTQQKLYFRSKLENDIQAKQVYSSIELLKRLSFQSDFEFFPPAAISTTKDMIEKSLFAFDGSPREFSIFLVRCYIRITKVPGTLVSLHTICQAFNGTQNCKVQC